MSTSVNLYRSDCTPIVDLVKHSGLESRFAVIHLGTLTVILPGDDADAAAVLRRISEACLLACHDLLGAVVSTDEQRIG